ncbi:MAG: zinc-ribbon domain-containing protein [bacterium]
MECTNCSAIIPANAKFCSECGAKVENIDSGVCTNCGETLKPSAKFCQNCGTPVKAGLEKAQVEELDETEQFQEKRNWLASVGPFMFIPIFAGIIVILFWKNRENTPLPPSNPSSAEQNAPDKAAMEQVHQTVERLQSKIKANPEDLVSIDSLAQMFYIAGSYDKAGKYLEMHLDIEPNNRDIKMFLATTYGNLNRNDEAIALIKGILKKEPTYAYGLYNLGVIYASTGNKEEALRNWKMVVQQHPGTEIAHAAEQHIQALEKSDQRPSN